MLESCTHEQLTQAADGLRLVVGPAAVAKVLRDHVAGLIRSRDAQRWASFLRYGHAVKRGSGPLQPINIDYDPDYEDAIVEALSRLDELGDLVDGELRAGETEQLLRGLRDRQ